MLFESTVFENVYLSNNYIFEYRHDLQEFLNKKYPDQDLNIDLLIEDEMVEYLDIDSEQCIILQRMGYKIYERRDIDED